MDALRRAAVAGSWYPSDPVGLSSIVDDYVGRADVGDIPRPAMAIIAPHAGLMYSGPVAAFAYKALRKIAYSAIVLVGPSHFVPFRGVSIWPEGAWDTPFGPVTVDRDLASVITSESDVIVEMAAAHRREHSLEMQLPFIAHMRPNVPIVPLVMGHQTRETAMGLGDTLARVLVSRTGAAAREENRTVLLVASSDLSHYRDALTAAALDAVVMQHVDAADPEGLMDTLEREPGHACGGGPMVAVLHAARQLGAAEARVLRYADSGDVSGDKSSVVGYMSAAIW